jgi:hypothetical protein
MCDVDPVVRCARRREYACTLLTDTRGHDHSQAIRVDSAVKPCETGVTGERLPRKALGPGERRNRCLLRLRVVERGGGYE